MAQLSRPFQIGLAVVVVLAAAWLLVLHRHSRSESTSAPGAAQVASTPTHTASTPSAPAKKNQGSAGQATGHGSATSLGAYGHAIEAARGAVVTSRQNEKQLSGRSSQASGETSTTSTGSSAETSSTARTGSSARTSSGPSSAKSTATKSAPAPTTSSPTKAKSQTQGAAHRSTTVTRQRQVEAQLAAGKIALVLFWDPSGADDKLVHNALRSLRGDARLKVAIDEASASQVASFGTITRGVQVYGTPTLLVVNKNGQAITLTGVQDAFTIAQAVREARHPEKA